MKNFRYGLLVGCEFTEDDITEKYPDYSDSSEDIKNRLITEFVYDIFDRRFISDLEIEMEDLEVEEDDEPEV